MRYIPVTLCRYLRTITRSPRAASRSATEVLPPGRSSQILRIRPSRTWWGIKVYSTFQVPFDPAFQTYTELDLDYVYALPVPAENRGLVFLVNYTSHESPYPTPDVHAFAIYLPAGYINAADNE
jgi:hypothetical protein